MRFWMIPLCVGLIVLAAWVIAPGASAVDLALIALAALFSLGVVFEAGRAEGRRDTREELDELQRDTGFTPFDPRP